MCACRLHYPVKHAPSPTHHGCTLPNPSVKRSDVCHAMDGLEAPDPNRPYLKRLQHVGGNVYRASFSDKEDKGR